MTDPIRCAILVCSDRCSTGESEDRSGATLKQILEAKPLNGVVLELKIVPDEKDIIKSALINWTDELKLDLVVTTGGTGFSKRDVTPEATKEVITKETIGLTIAMMTESLTKTPMAMLSRATSGIRGNSLIVNLPGSKKGSVECFEAIVHQLPHAIDLIRNSHSNIEEVHSKMAMPSMPSVVQPKQKQPHICPHKQKTVNFQKTSIKDNPAGRDRKSPWPMMSVQDALRMIFEKIETVDSEEIDVRNSNSRVLAVDISSKVSLPPFPASIKDGYAVRSADGAGVRKVVSSIAAGDDPSNIFVTSGFIARINTGAPLPKGADAVIQVEDTQVVKQNSSGEELEVSVTAVPVGNDVRPIGSDIEMSEHLLSRGALIGPAQIGVCATTGNGKIEVFRKIRVVVFSTGAEVVEVGKELTYGQIYDSNRHVLINSLENLGYCEVIDGGILPDIPQVCLDAFKAELNNKCDIIITSGGVSMGDKDYIKTILTDDLQGSIHFGRVNMKPGKPTTFGTLEKCLFFGLPGNPSSSAVTFNLFVKPTLKALTGQSPKPTIIKGKLENIINLDARPEYHRCKLEFHRDNDVPIVKSTGSQCSANINSMSQAQGLIIAPAITDNKKNIKADELVSVMLFHDL